MEVLISFQKQNKLANLQKCGDAKLEVYGKTNETHYYDSSVAVSIKRYIAATVFVSKNLRKYKCVLRVCKTLYINKKDFEIFTKTFQSPMSKHL